MTGPTPDELLPGGLRRPTSLFLSGSNQSLLNWVTLALLSPYAARIYWTAIQLPGESFESLDPLGRGVLPADHLDVVHPNRLRRQEEVGHQAEVAAATVLRSDEHPEALRRLVEFLRLPSHSQELLASTTGGSAPPILVLSNVIRIATLYSNSSVGPTVQSFLDSGAVLVLLWAGGVTPRRRVFDIVLHVEGTEPLRWREAVLWCEQGIQEGPLAGGRRHTVADLPSLASYLERWIPSRVGR